MTDRDPLTIRVARLARISDEQVSDLAGTAGREALLEEITAMPLTDPASPARRRRRVPIVAAISVVVVGGTAAAGWAIFNSPARNTISIECEIAGIDTVIPSESGNAVQDCAAQWQRDTGSAAPTLVAYDNAHNGITVQPASEPPQPGETKLPAGITQNVALIDLQESMDDFVAGLNSGCYDNAAAVQIANHNLNALGLTGWTVVPAPPIHDKPPASDAPIPSATPGSGQPSQAPGVVGTQQCVNTTILNPATKTLSLLASFGPGSSTTSFEQLAVKLRSIAKDCQPLAATAQQVEAAATDLGLSQSAHDYELTEVPQQDAGCTTIHETVGGLIFLTLRGPTG
jgi:hypothetical protein